MEQDQKISGRKGITRTKFAGFIVRTKEDHVGAYAAQAAYFLIMSFIPFLLFFTTLLKYTPVTYNDLREAIIAVVPQNLQEFVMGIVVDIYRKGTAIMPVSAVVALWSAGKGIQALTNGLNTIYHVEETRNWLITRCYSVFYSLLFALALAFSLAMLVVSSQVRQFFAEALPVLGRLPGQMLLTRFLLVFVTLFLVFLLLFWAIPNRKATFRSQVPGAFLTAAAWMLFSFFFSLYFKLFPEFSNMYGNLTSLILVMLWLYFCMMIMLFGAEVNSYFENELRTAWHTVEKNLDEQNRKQTKTNKNKEKN